VDIIENRYRMIIEPERSGKSISDVCIAFGISRETWYKWKRRYDAYGVDVLKVVIDTYAELNRKADSDKSVGSAQNVMSWNGLFRDYIFLFQDCNTIT
jgi:transposase-like protein